MCILKAVSYSIKHTENKRKQNDFNDKRPLKFALQGFSTVYFSCKTIHEHVDKQGEAWNIHLSSLLQNKTQSLTNKTDHKKPVIPKSNFCKKELKHTKMSVYNLNIKQLEHWQSYPVQRLYHTVITVTINTSSKNIFKLTYSTINQKCIPFNLQQNMVIHVIIRVHQCLA